MPPTPASGRARSRRRCAAGTSVPRLRPQRNLRARSGSTRARPTPTGWGPQTRGRVGPLQFPPPPSERSAPHTAGGSSALRLQALHAFHGLHRDTPGSAPPWSPHGVGITPRQASLDATDRSVAPPLSGLSTLGFDAGRYPPTPPACYQAPWRLPGRDSHPLAETSLRTPTIRSSSPPPSDPIARALWTRSS